MTYDYGYVCKNAFKEYTVARVCCLVNHIGVKRIKPLVSFSGIGGTICFPRRILYFKSNQLFLECPLQIEYERQCTNVLT